MDDSLEIGQLARGFENVQGAIDVGLVYFEGMIEGKIHVGRRGKVQDDLRLVQDDDPHSVGRTEIAAEDVLEFVVQILRDVAQSLHRGSGLRGIADEERDLRPEPQQFLGQVRSDEAVGAGKQHPFAAVGSFEVERADLAQGRRQFFLRHKNSPFATVMRKRAPKRTRPRGTWKRFEIPAWRS